MHISISVSIHCYRNLFIRLSLIILKTIDFETYIHGYDTPQPKAQVINYLEEQLSML